MTQPALYFAPYLHISPISSLKLLYFYINTTYADITLIMQEKNFFFACSILNTKWLLKYWNFFDAALMIRKKVAIIQKWIL